MSFGLTQDFMQRGRAPSPQVTNGCFSCGGGPNGFVKHDGQNNHAKWCPSHPKQESTKR